MSEHENLLLKAIQKSLINYLIGFGLTIVTIGVTGYFALTYESKQNKADIQELKQVKADKAVMESELKAINGSLIRIEGKIDNQRNN